MCQIWVQWSHFSRLLVTVDFDDGFNTKVWSVDHIIIVTVSFWMDGWMRTLVRGFNPSLRNIHWPLFPPPSHLAALWAE